MNEIASESNILMVMRATREAQSALFAAKTTGTEIPVDCYEGRVGEAFPLFQDLVQRGAAMTDQEIRAMCDDVEEHALAVFQQTAAAAISASVPGLVTAALAGIGIEGLTSASPTGGQPGSSELSKTDSQTKGTPIETLGLSTKARTLLLQNNVSTVEQLTGKTVDDLLHIRNFGKDRLIEVVKKLGIKGLSLHGDLSNIALRLGVAREDLTPARGLTQESQINDLELSSNLISILKRVGINTVGQLTAMSPSNLHHATLATGKHNFIGPMRMIEIVETLRNRGLSLQPEQRRQP